MPSILTQHYHTQLATEVKSRLAWSETIDALAANGTISADTKTTLISSANSATLYLFVGYPSPWPVDVDPPAPVENPQTTGFDYWRNMLAAKRVSSSNTQPVVPRNNWTSNTVYTQYDDQADLTDTQFFVLVLDGGTTWRVYKCLWNKGGVVSTSQPTGTGLTTYADGYVWKYMYTIPLMNDRFLTDAWMPVYANSTVQAAALSLTGALPTEVPLVVIYSGANYNASVNATATIAGDGTGATVANAGISIVGGTVTGITLATSGVGYTNVETVSVVQTGNVATATARVIIPPYPNHGYDPIFELQAKHLMCVVQFADTEAGKLTVNNNFRQVGLLAEPLLANGVLATDTIYKQTWDVTIQAGGPTYNPDDLVINTTLTPSPSGVVVDVLPGSGGKQIIRLVDVNVRGLAAPFQTGDVLKVGGINSSTVSDDAVSGPELLPYAGHVLYVNQRIPVTRASGETQDLKVVLPFG